MNSPRRGCRAFYDAHHVQVKSVNGVPSWELYLQYRDYWELRFERDGETTVSKHATVLEAANRAKELRERPSHPEMVKNRPMLHLYLRHPRATRTCENVWQGDFRLLSIKTYEFVAQCYKAARKGGHRIRVYRRNSRGFPPLYAAKSATHGRLT